MWAVSKLRRAKFSVERQCIEGYCCWPVIRQARDSVGRCEQLSSVVPTGATTALNNIGDVHDASPPSPFNFTSPPTRAAGWADQPAEVSDTSRRGCGGPRDAEIIYSSRTRRPRARPRVAVNSALRSRPPLVRRTDAVTDV